MSKLTYRQAVIAEREMRRLEKEPSVSKKELRLFMQSLMPCGHVMSNLLTCPDPPYGCVVCLHQRKLERQLKRRISKATRNKKKIKP